MKNAGPTKRKTSKSQSPTNNDVAISSNSHNGTSSSSYDVESDNKYAKHRSIQNNRMRSGMIWGMLFGIVLYGSIQYLEDHKAPGLIRRIEETDQQKQQLPVGHNDYSGLNMEQLQEEFYSLDFRVRQYKDSIAVLNNVYMETDPNAVKLTRALQDVTRQLLLTRYGPPPYRVEFTVLFPPAYADTELHQGPTGTILLQMADIEIVPVSVYFYLEIVRTFVSGSFHRNAPHVLQVQMVTNSEFTQRSLPFQEYSDQNPHKQFTTGFGGRPSGPGWYISVQDNTLNHGPGSQQDHNPYEADACFGAVLEGIDSGVIPRIHSVESDGWLEPSLEVPIIEMQILTTNGVDTNEYHKWEDPALQQQQQQQQQESHEDQYATPPEQESNGNNMANEIQNAIQDENSNQNVDASDMVNVPNDGAESNQDTFQESEQNANEEDGSAAFRQDDENAKDENNGQENPEQNEGHPEDVVLEDASKKSAGQLDGEDSVVSPDADHNVEEHGLTNDDAAAAAAEEVHPAPDGKTAADDVNDDKVVLSPDEDHTDEPVHGVVNEDTNVIKKAEAKAVSKQEGSAAAVKGMKDAIVRVDPVDVDEHDEPQKRGVKQETVKGGKTRSTPKIGANTGGDETIKDLNNRAKKKVSSLVEPEDKYMEMARNMAKKKAKTMGANRNGLNKSKKQ